MTQPTSGEQRDELYELVDQIQTAMLTTRRPDGELVARPMQTQKRSDLADFWFVTSSETHKIDELEQDPHVNLAYLHGRTREFVSISGKVRLVRDRETIRRLHDDSWRTWMENRGGAMDGGPDDPRYVLLVVEPSSAVWFHLDKSEPRALYEVVKGKLTGKRPQLGEVKKLSGSELR